MYICMTWQKFILKKKPRKFMHIHIFDISPLDYFWTDCLIRFCFFLFAMCAKKSVFASTREQPGAWWTVLVTQKGNPV